MNELFSKGALTAIQPIVYVCEKTMEKNNEWKKLMEMVVSSHLRSKAILTDYCVAMSKISGDSPDIIKERIKNKMMELQKELKSELENLQPPS